MEFPRSLPSSWSATVRLLPSLRRHLANELDSAGVIGTQPTSPSQSLPNPIGNNLFQTGAKTPSDSNASGGVGAKEEGSGASEVLVGWMLGVVGVLAVGML